MDDALDTVQLDHNMAPNIFKPGEFVLIRTEMTAEDDIVIKNRLAKMRGQGKNSEMVMNLGDAQLATMQRMIVGWNLSAKTIDQNGNIRMIPLVFSPENVKRMRKPTWDYVYQKINELNPDMDEEEKKDTSNGSSEHTGESSNQENIYRLK